MKKPAALFECVLGCHKYGNLKRYPYITDKYGHFCPWYRECGICGDKLLIISSEFITQFEGMIKDTFAGVILISDTHIKQNHK